MQTCTEGCEHWAQWRMAVPIKEADAKAPKFQKIVGWRTLGLLCREHKEILEKAPSELNLHFAFIGAAPSGTHNP